MARKGTTITEDQVQWSEISTESWASAQAAAQARAANGNPMTDAEIEARARNIQDRADLRRTVPGVNLRQDTKGLSRSEMVALVNAQLAEGLYSNPRRAGIQALQDKYGHDSAARIVKKYSGRTIR